MPVIVQNPNTMLLLDAKKDIARVLGNADDTAMQSLAGDCIRDVIQGLNTARDWTWMQNSTTGNTVANQATIAIPNRTKKIFDLVVNNFTLVYVNQHDWDRQISQGGSSSVGGTLFYTIFDIAGTNNITLRDTPGAVYPYTLKYCRLIDYPANDATAIDVPENAMAYILSKAKSDFIARINGDSEKLKFFTMQAEQRYKQLVSEDTRQPDEEVMFQPGYLNPTPLNPNYDYFYVYWD